MMRDSILPTLLGNSVSAKDSFPDTSGGAPRSGRPCSRDKNDSQRPLRERLAAAGCQWTNRRCKSILPVGGMGCMLDILITNRGHRSITIRPGHVGPQLRDNLRQRHEHYRIILFCEDVAHLRPRARGHRNAASPSAFGSVGCNRFGWRCED
jgi:hypothetical protein